MDNITKEYYNKVKPLVTKIRNYKCPNCNGNYTNCECDFCGEKNEELEESLNSLEEILNNFKLNTKDKDINNINIFFNSLMTIENSQDIIKNFLKQYNYQPKFYEYTKEILLRINKNESLSNLDINTIETLIFQKNNNYDLTKLHKYFITQSLQKKQNVSLECFQEIIKQIVETTLQPYYKSNIQCIIKNYKPIDNYITLGENNAYKIYINTDEIEKLYNNQNPNILKVLFHECIHGIQSKKIFQNNQELDPLSLLEIKDKILSYNNPNYYNENYNNLSFEIEAEYYGQLLASKYTEKSLITPEIQQKYRNILNQTRTLNGQKTRYRYNIQ